MNGETLSESMYYATKGLLSALNFDTVWRSVARFMLQGKGPKATHWIGKISSYVGNRTLVIKITASHFSE